MDVFYWLDPIQAGEKSMSEGVVYHLVNLTISFKEEESVTSQYHVSFHILMKMNHEIKG